MSPTGNNAQPTVDLVVVSYGSGALVASAVSAAKRFCALASVTVVENDPSAVLVEVPGGRFIRNATNVGYAAAVNSAVMVGKSDLIWLLNPDILAITGDRTGFLAALAPPDVASVSPQLVDEQGCVEPSCRRVPSILDFLLEDVAASRRWPLWRRAQRFRMLDAAGGATEVASVTGACLFIRREAWRDVGPFDEGFFVYGEEMDWMRRASGRGWRHWYAPTVAAVHVSGGSAAIPDIARETLQLRAMYRYTRKHLGLTSALALRALLVMLDVLRLPTSHSRGRTGEVSRRINRIRVHLGLGPAPDAAI